MFFARYLPPEQWPALGGAIPPNLLPPPLALTFEQQFYAGAYLGSFSQITAPCQVFLTWATSNGSGMTSVP